MAEELSPSDRSSLAAERGPVNMAVGAALVFDAGPGVEYGAVVERLRSRMHLIPRYRQRIEEALPGGLTQPVWVDDTSFDPAWHVRHATLPAPGGDAELAAFVAREFSRRLDRSRPLWELHVVDGLADDRVALVPKMHHALVDGVAAIDVGTVLLDPTEEPIDIEPLGRRVGAPAVRAHAPHGAARRDAVPARAASDARHRDARARHEPAQRRRRPEAGERAGAPS